MPDVLALSSPAGVAFDASARVTYVAVGSSSATRIYRVINDVATPWVGSGWAGSNDGPLTANAATFANPSGIACSGAGRCFVTEFSPTGTVTIRVINMATYNVSTLTTSVAITAQASVGWSHLAWDAQTSSLLLGATANAMSVLRVNVNDGTVTRFTGGGATGTVGGSANGVGTNALFTQVNSMCADPLAPGRVVFIEKLQNRIRKTLDALPTVDILAGGGATGVLSGYADGMGTNALFISPITCAFSRVGSVFVADSGNHKIRAVDYVTGVATTLAGNAGAASVSGQVDGSASTSRFNFPLALALDDDSGVLYVLDYVSYIRRVRISDGSVLTIAGAMTTISWMSSAWMDGSCGSAVFTTPVSIAVDPLSRDVLVTSEKGNVRRVNIASGTVTTIAGVGAGTGSTAAAGLDGVGAGVGFTSIRHMTVDTAGNVWVVDAGRVRILNVTSRTARTIPSVASSNYLYTNVYDAPAEGYTFSIRYPTRVLYEPSLNGIFVYNQNAGVYTSLVFANSSGVAVLGYSTAAIAATTPVGARANVGLGSGGALAWDRLRKVGYVVCSTRAAILQFSLNGTFSILVGGSGTSASVDGVGSAAQIAGVQGLTMSPTGDALFFVENVGMRLRKVIISTATVVSLTGTIPATANMASGNVDGLATNVRFNGPVDVVYDAFTGKLLVSDFSNNKLRSSDPVTGDTTTLVGSFPFSNIGRLATTGTGLVFVWDQSSLSLNPGPVLQMVNLSAQTVTSILGVTSANVGSQLSTYIGTGDGPGSSARMAPPGSLTYDSSRNHLYFSDQENNVIRGVDLNAAVPTAYTLATNPPFMSASPSGIAWDAVTNTALVADTHRLRRVWPSGKMITVGGSGFRGSRNGPGSGFAGFIFSGWGSAPWQLGGGIAKLSNGSLIVSDTNNGIVRLLTPVFAPGDVAPNFVVTTLAGTAGVQQMKGGAAQSVLSAPYNNVLVSPTGLAARSASDVVYIVENGSNGKGGNRVRVWSNATLSILAGNAVGTTFTAVNGIGTNAQLTNTFCALLVDNEASLLVGEMTYPSASGNGAIRKIDTATGNAILWLGTGAAPPNPVLDNTAAASAAFDGPIALALDSAQNVYILEAWSPRIRVWSAATTLVSIVAGTIGVTSGFADGVGTNALFKQPQGMSLDAANNVIYVADT